jgi:hypothetical protein
VQNVDTVFSGHFVIDDEDVVFTSLKHGDTRFAVMDHIHLVSGTLQSTFRQVSLGSVIFHD